MTTATATLTDATPETREFDSQYVSFWIANQLLGVPVNSVQEVLNQQPIGAVPKSRPEIAGLLNLRGQIVMAVDMRVRLKLPPQEDAEKIMNVVVRHNGEPYSLLVDEVGDVIDVDPQSVTSVPNTLEANWREITDSVVRLDKQLLIILDVPQLLRF
ncbi:MAG: chemotaxis protein CheW [Planctomycetaceae bacterium]